MAQRLISVLVKKHVERMKKMEAGWYKLKSGKWGVRTKFEAQAGTEIEVTNKEGKTSTVTLASRVAKFDDAELWEIEE